LEEMPVSDSLVLNFGPFFPTTSAYN